MTYPPTGIVQGTPPSLELEWKGKTLHIGGVLMIDGNSHLEQDLERTTGDVDFNLSKLRLVDDLGLASFIKWKRHLSKHGAKLRLLRTLTVVWTSLSVCKMRELFDLVEPPQE